MAIIDVKYPLKKIAYQIIPPLIYTKEPEAYEDLEISLDDFDECQETKECCKKCGCSDIKYVNMAMKCENCWHTW